MSCGGLICYFSFVRCFYDLSYIHLFHCILLFAPFATSFTFRNILMLNFLFLVVLENGLREVEMLRLFIISFYFIFKKLPVLIKI